MKPVLNVVEAERYLINTEEQDEIIDDKNGAKMIKELGDDWNRP